MTCFKKSNLTFVVAALIVGAPGLTYAEDLSVSGVTCKPDELDKSTDLDFHGTGVFNAGSTSRRVWCAVTRMPGDAGETFYADVNNPSGKKTVCGFVYYDYTGGGGFSTSQSISDVGAQYATFSVPDEQVFHWGFGTIFCDLPPGGTLYGLNYSS